MNYYSRYAKIRELCTNKVVLDIGCAMHRKYEEAIRDGRWIHEIIREVAKKVVGIDYLQDQVEFLNRKGYEVYHVNAEKLEDLKLEQKFDVIVAGELIEHLSNPGLFLEGAKRFLNDDGILIITTPNCFAYHRFKLLLNNVTENKWLNKEHTQWYSFYTLQQLLERHGYKPEDYSYYDDNNNNNIKVKVKKFLNYNKVNISHFADGLFFIAKL
jgi:2-polyprenyl-3-methyl-5-hydroxy-6-metoxy-1,4-benzoquinol methylase